MAAESKIKEIFENTSGDTERIVKLLKLLEHYYWLAVVLGGTAGVSITCLFHAMFIFR